MKCQDGKGKRVYTLILVFSHEENTTDQVKRVLYIISTNDHVCSISFASFRVYIGYDDFPSLEGFAEKLQKDVHVSLSASF